MNAFVTGSRVYGTPKPDSDIDLVVLTSDADEVLLWNLSEREYKVLYGRLNLIIYSADQPEGVAKFEAWKKVTEELIARKPVTREEAVAALENVGISQSDYDPVE